MKPVFIETKNTVRGREALSVIEDIERGQPGLGCFYGEASVGKTMFVTHYTVQTNAIYLRVLEDWTPRAMLGALCREINGSDPPSVEKCKLAVCRALEARQESGGSLGSTAVFVDEADRLSVNLVEHFRDIHDLTGAPVVLVGEPHLLPILRARSRLWDRVNQVIEFSRIEADDISVFAMRAADLRLDPDAAQKLVKRTDGKFRRIRNDVSGLEQMARAAGVKQVSARMVDALPQMESELKQPRRGK